MKTYKFVGQKLSDGQSSVVGVNSVILNEPKRIKYAETLNQNNNSKEVTF